MKVIIDLHAAIGSQNGEEHSATIDGVSEWATGRDPNGKSYVELTLEVIEFLASRYIFSSLRYFGIIAMMIISRIHLNHPFVRTDIYVWS